MGFFAMIGRRAFIVESFESALETARSLDWPEWRPDKERLRDLDQWLDHLYDLDERQRVKRSPFTFALGHAGLVDDDTGRVHQHRIDLTIRAT